MKKHQLTFSLRNPVIASHKVYNQAILPGLAYIDILFQFFRKQGYPYQALEVKNLTIHNPLLVGEESKIVVSLACTEAGEGQWKVRIEGSELKNPAVLPNSLLYVTADVLQNEAFFSPETLDIGSAKQSAKTANLIADIYDTYRTEGLVHEGFMQATGTIYALEEGVLFEASLGKEAMLTADHFMFHPALMDASAVASRQLFTALVAEGENLFLPLYYESFRATTLINQRCYAYIPVSSISRKNEITSLSIHFFDEAGKKIGELTNLTTKMVRKGLGNGSAEPPRQMTVSFPKNEVHYPSEGAVALLKQLIGSQLNVDVHQVETQVGYYDLGLQSVNLLQLAGAVSTAVEADLPPTLLFEFPNIAALADYLANEYAQKFTSPAAHQNDKASPSGQNGLHSNGSANHSYKDKNVVKPFYEAGTPPSNGVTKPNEDVAIIGMAGRYPQARNLEEFWENLKAGRDCITPVPDSRWQVTQYEGIKSPSGKSISQWGGFISEPDRFDPRFFRISAREAEVMDPQERLFLETCWQTIEDAGYTPDSLVTHPDKKGKKKVGVFTGVMHKDYSLVGNDAIAKGGLVPLSLNNASIANRVSYFCDFHGPSMVVDTACSSSLVAVHLALQSIRLGESEVALAGGVNLSLHSGKYLTYGLVDMHSSDGYCKAFGKGGDGYVSAEGVGAVLLKPLPQAIRDGDHIYAVIKGSSINHVGSVSGMTVPSPVAQAAMIEECLAKTGIDARTLSYIEAHGTGTSLGDPIEMQGLVKAFSAYTDDKQFCSIGSVKSNIGHAEAAAGISGLTKLALQFKHKTLVPSLHAEEPNPYIDLQHSPFFVQRNVGVWKRPEIRKAGEVVSYPRRAGISSFGASGTNAHIILEEYIPIEVESPEIADIDTVEHAFMIPLSAKSKESLKAGAATLFHYVSRLLAEKRQPLTGKESQKDLLNLAYTLQVGRVAMDERVLFIAKGVESLAEQIGAYLKDDGTGPFFQGNAKRNATHSALLKYLNSQQLLEEGKRSHNFDQLGEAWVNGVDLPWSQLYERGHNYYGRKPRRISLPTYSFAKEYYWIPQTAKVEEALAPKEAGTASNMATPPEGRFVTPARAQSASEAEEPDSELLLEKIVNKLKMLFAGIVKFSADTIDEKERLESYGIDSIMIVELNKQLAEVYGELPATLFYEYQTLEALAGCLCGEYRERSIAWTGIRRVAADDQLSKQNASVRTKDAFPVPAIHRENSRKSANPVQHSTAEKQEPVAIIGVSGRYPQAANLREYWANLQSGKDCITEVPGDRWNMPDFFHADSATAASLGKSYGKWGSFIEGFADFDPRFFSLSPKEVRAMDPQIRLFLESCWQVLEDAGYTKEQLMKWYNGNVGVFAGVTRAGFSLYAPELGKNGQYPLNTMSAVANRASYLLNLKGPSVPVDTMCSSSLTAIHQACESLTKGECEMAIAGGVNLLMHPAEYVMLSANNFLSTDGRCRSFGAGGDGYVPGEGVGTVLLKPLSRAIEDQDQIYAVIRGSSINHGGKTNGYTVPNPVAQGELVRSALDRAGINAREVSYIEAHGTGTPLGDPIEIAGLKQAFGADTSDTQYCAIGSAKSNIGHLEAAAGIAGLTKIILQMKHGMLAPSLHATALNPNIHFEKSPFFVQQTLSEWKRPVVAVNGEKRELTRIAGISSFGAGGANAHVILEEYVPENDSRPVTGVSLKITTQDPVIVLLSARSEERLKVYAQQLAAAIRRGEYQEYQLPAMAYTLHTGREAMEERLALEASSLDELVNKLEAFTGDKPLPEGVFEGKIKDHKETISLLTADKEMAATVNTWITGKKYSKLMGLWVKGLPVDWNQLYGNSPDQHPVPGRMSLPTYPFDRKRYWITETNTGLDPIPAVVAPANSEAPARSHLEPAEAPSGQKTDAPGSTPQAVSTNAKRPVTQKEEASTLMTFEEVWQEKGVEESIRTGINQPVKTLVCFASEPKSQQAVRAAVAELSPATNVVFISHRNDSTGADDKQYVIRKKEDAESYKAVFGEITATHGEMDAVVYLWALEDLSFIHNYNVLVAVLQGMGTAKVQTKHFLLAGQWEQPGEESGLNRCYLESWIGFERSLRLILPGVGLKAVYRETPDDQVDLKAWMGVLWTELYSPETRSALHKAGKRYLYQVQPTALQSGTNQLQKGGTYLITGGLGSLGLLFAGYLADHYSANLILTGRSSIDAGKQEAIRHLERSGGRIFYLQADVCDEAAMRAGLHRAKERFGRINGVIHAAGVIGAEMLPDKTPQSFGRVLAPKVQGTVVLDELLQAESLDFVCCFTLFRGDSR